MRRSPFIVFFVSHSPFTAFLFSLCYMMNLPYLYSGQLSFDIFVDGDCDENATPLTSAAPSALSSASSFESFSSNSSSTAAPSSTLGSASSSSFSHAESPANALYNSQLLTPILETSRESIRSTGTHGTNTSTQETPIAIHNDCESSMVVVDPFHPTERKRLLERSGVLGCKEVFDNRGEKPSFGLADVINGDEVDVELGERFLHIESALNVDIPQEEEEEETDLDEGALQLWYKFAVQDLDADDEANMCLRLSPPTQLWSLHISNQLRERLARVKVSPSACLPASRGRYFHLAQESYLFDNSTCTLGQVSDHGSLQTVLNTYEQHSKCMNETLVMFYAIEMLRILEMLHKCNIVHGAITPTVFAIRNSECDQEWGEWNINGDQGWSSKGLALTGFSRSIDLLLISHNHVQGGAGPLSLDNSSAPTREVQAVLSKIKFQTNCAVTSQNFPCIEMTTNEPWTTQIDTFGLCNIIHLLLHGEPMQVVQVESRSNTVYSDADGADMMWMPQKSFDQEPGWSTDLWNGIFGELLNVGGEGQQPDLADIRKRIEMALISDESKIKALKVLLCKQNIMMCDAQQ